MTENDSSKKKNSLEPRNRTSCFVYFVLHDVISSCITNINKCVTVILHNEHMTSYDKYLNDKY